MSDLTRNYILAVVSEESAVACVGVDLVLGMSIGSNVKLARRRAMLRILRETACDPRKLARLWGCDPCVVYRAKNFDTPRPSAYDPDTARRLQWAHGDQRAAAILKGNDTATLDDIASWRSLGQRSAA